MPATPLMQCCQRVDYVSFSPYNIIIVDADRSGGIAYLLDCWQFMAHNRDKNIPCVSLFYIFLTPPGRNSSIYHELWDFLYTKTEIEVGPRLQAHFGVIQRDFTIDSHADFPSTVIEYCRAQFKEQGILDSFERCTAGG